MPAHPPEPRNSFYVTTPIYYVNDRPHIGHCYTTLVADVIARFERLSGREVFFLTGTDEHADKVVTSAAAHSMTPLEWADHNAAEFKAAFEFINASNDDFIRTTEERHKSKVVAYIRELQKLGDVYLGDYTGWWDPSQEEYLTDNVAKESKFGPYTSPVTGRPLEKRTEKNYFFRLSKYQDALKKHIEAHPEFILPEARRNEVMGRLRDGLQDIPISRAVTADATTQWGIRMPDDPGHRIYVWIDALFNYLSVVDTPGREHWWPASVHVLAKDILWFHAVIWPCLLMAMKRELPRTVYVHSYWVSEGKKMSKSLGNFIDLEVLKAYAARYSLDGLRWYLLTQGPLRENDADFSYAKFVEVYNADLANGIGNCASRVANMIEKYFGGKLPDLGVTDDEAWTKFTPAGHTTFDFSALAHEAVHGAERELAALRVDEALMQGTALVGQVDLFINHTRPFSIAKEIEKGVAGAEEIERLRRELAHILMLCAEAVRVASVLLSPAMPQKMEQLWTAWNCRPNPGVPLSELCAFGGPHALKPGQPVAKGEGLFMRAKAEDPAPKAG